jgi:hypothetical protein
MRGAYDARIRTSYSVRRWHDGELISVQRTCAIRFVSSSRHRSTVLMLQRLARPAMQRVAAATTPLAMRVRTPILARALTQASVPQAHAATPVAAAHPTPAPHADAHHAVDRRLEEPWLFGEDVSRYTCHAHTAPLSVSGIRLTVSRALALSAVRFSADCAARSRGLGVALLHRHGYVLRDVVCRRHVRTRYVALEVGA